MKRLKIIGLIVLLACLVLPTFVGATLDSTYYPTNPGLPGTQNTTIGNLIFRIIQILLLVVGMLTVLFIIIGGYQYITSGANEELAESGKKTLTNAVIGLVIVILSFVIVSVIYNTLRLDGIS